MTASYKDKHALITRGTSGIGGAIAGAFETAGCSVTRAVLEEGDNHTVVDVTDKSGVRDVVESLDCLDILVNAAGMILRDGHEYDVDSFDKVVDANLTGTMRACTACKAALTESNG